LLAAERLPLGADTFTDSLNDFDGVNRGSLIGGIIMSSPVRGLTPRLAFISTTRNVPRSEILILPPFALSESWIVLMMASKTTVAAFLLMSAFSEIKDTISGFVILFPP
jgi:hypothetical protein